MIAIGFFELLVIVLIALLGVGLLGGVVAAVVIAASRGHRENRP